MNPYSEALLRSDYMNNTLPSIVHSKVLEAKCLDVPLKGRALGSGVGLSHKLLDSREMLARSRSVRLDECISHRESLSKGPHSRNVMVYGCEGAVRSADRTTGSTSRNGI